MELLSTIAEIIPNLLILKDAGQQPAQTPPRGANSLRRSHGRSGRFRDPDRANPRQRSGLRLCAPRHARLVVVHPLGLCLAHVQGICAAWAAADRPYGR
jgi:hypothetical protein